MFTGLDPDVFTDCQLIFPEVYHVTESFEIFYDANLTLPDRDKYSRFPIDRYLESANGFVCF